MKFDCCYTWYVAQALGKILLGMRNLIFIFSLNSFNFGCFPLLSGGKTVLTRSHLAHQGRKQDFEKRTPRANTRHTGVISAQKTT